MSRDKSESALEEYIREKNVFIRVFNLRDKEIEQPLSEDEYNYLIAELETDTSPENLTNDGEASTSYIAQRHELLTEARVELELGGHES